MVKRTRNKAVTLRMTPTNGRFFKVNSRSPAQKSKLDFVLRLLDHKPVSVDYELLDILAELKRHGNLNQLARQLNQGSPFQKGQKVLNECWRAYYRTLSESRKGDDFASIQGFRLQSTPDKVLNYYIMDSRKATLISSLEFR